MTSGNFLFHYILIYLIPLILTIIGLIYRSHPPKYPKGDTLALSGYRSHMSMLSEDIWKTAPAAV